jgi:transglycosylase-like protein with SLT domain
VSHVSQSLRRVASSIRFAPKALFVTGVLAASLAGATVASSATAQASAGLQYQRGYSLQNGWYCYGWANGAYHCTHHWGRTKNGHLISYNSAWVPNYGAGRSSVRLAPSHHTASASHPASHGAGSYNPGRSAIANEIRAVFGRYSNQALAIAQCESGLNPNARNPRPVGGAHAAGVFQILDTSTWYTTSYRHASPYNASANIRAAYEIFHRDGNSWREWACRP